MDPQEIIDYHLNKKKFQENKEEIKECAKCQGNMKQTGKRTSGNVNYLVWTCQRCGVEKVELHSLNPADK